MSLLNDIFFVSATPCRAIAARQRNAKQKWFATSKGAPIAEKGNTRVAIHLIPWRWMNADRSGRSAGGLYAM